jgi:hypothetical protein
MGGFEACRSGASSTFLTWLEPGRQQAVPLNISAPADPHIGLDDVMVVELSDPDQKRVSLFSSR